MEELEHGGRLIKGQDKISSCSLDEHNDFDITRKFCNLKKEDIVNLLTPSSGDSNNSIFKIEVESV